MPLLEDLAWSTAVDHTRWLADRLGDHSKNTVTDVVPAGFDAYARVLHPAKDATPGGRRLIRWRDVAAWSGCPMEPEAPFHAVAIPQEPVAATPPWSGQGPCQGSLAVADARSLCAVVRRHTRTPEDCWFCLWDGYGWTGVPLTSGDADGESEAVATADDPIPAAVRHGPRVELPHRSYLLYRGPVECALVQWGERPRHQTANLWWPEDRGWCVASEIDLAWTYVGGSVALVRALVGNPGLEAVEVAPDSPVAVVEPRISRLVEPAVEALLSDGEATVVTPVGSVEAELQLPRRSGRGSLRYRAQSALGHHSSGTHAVAATRRDRSELRRDLAGHLEHAVINLVGD